MCIFLSISVGEFHVYFLVSICKRVDCFYSAKNIHFVMDDFSLLLSLGETPFYLLSHLLIYFLFAVQNDTSILLMLTII